MRRLVLLVALLTLANRVVAAQEPPPPLAQRLGAQTVAELRPIIDSARMDSLPVPALVSKALEGSAKRIPATRIVVAVRQLAADLRSARNLLRSAARSAALSDGEITAAADARHRGVPAKEIAALRSRALPATGLDVAFTVLGDLVQRGVPADQGRVVIEQLLSAGVPASQIAQITARVDAGLNLGAPPRDALHNALQAPSSSPAPKEAKEAKPPKPPNPPKPPKPPKNKVPSHP